MKIEIPVKYMNSVCRVCLIEQKLLIPLHEINITHNLNPQGSVEHVTLKAVFLKYCNILVHIHDRKPQKICLSCMNTMCKAFNFFELFLQSNALLEDILRKHEEKEREAALHQIHPEPPEPNTNPLDILPSVVLKHILKEIEQNNSVDPSCPIVYVETLNTNIIGSDNEDTIVLPENNSNFKNNFYITSKVIKAKPKVAKANSDGTGNIDDMDKEVASINNNVKDEGVEINYIRRRYRIKTPPYFISDPSGSLKDHCYIMSEKRFTRLQRKRLRRKRMPRPVKVKIRKPKPIKISRQALKEKQKKYEQENDIFRCKLCRKTYSGIARVLEHVKDEHVHSKRCILCPQEIKTQKTMMYHVAAHSKFGLVCRICRLYFEDKDSLEHHNSEIDHTEALKCQICGKTFTKMSVKKTHMEGVHQNTGKFNHQCSHCGLILKWRNNLERHERTHQELSKRKSFLCQICANCFSTKYALEFHVKVVHEGQTHLRARYKKNKYPELPDKKKISPEKRRKTEEQRKKIYECQFCQRKFGLEHAFNKHCRSHPEFKSLKCPYCIGVFENSEKYREHRALEHSLFRCVVCEKGFATKWILTSHANTHVKRHKCDMCVRDFASPQALEIHKRVHTGERPFKCEYCDKAFKQQSQVAQHIMCMHTQKNHKCNVCGKTFNYPYGLSGHMRTHTGEKPFACLYCDKRFRDTVSRHKHVKRDHTEKMEEFLAYKKLFRDQEAMELLLKQ